MCQTCRERLVVFLALQGRRKNIIARRKSGGHIFYFLMLEIRILRSRKIKWLPIAIGWLTESHGEIQGLQSLECVDHPNKILKTWMEPITLPWQFSLSAGWAFVYFLQLTSHVQKHALQKLSPILKLAILFFFTIVKHVSAEIYLKIFLHEAWGNLSLCHPFVTYASSSGLPYRCTSAQPCTPTRFIYTC